MWYYTLNNQQVGPVDEKEIKTLIAAGTITHGTLVWTNGMEKLAAHWADTPRFLNGFCSPTGRTNCRAHCL